MDWHASRDATIIVSIILSFEVVLAAMTGVSHIARRETDQGLTDGRVTLGARCRRFPQFP